MTTLLLVRHGETDWNAEGRLQGHTDRPLNDFGRRQAHALADRLAGEHDRRGLRERPRRAHETAEILGERLGLAVAVDPELREKNWGNWEGLTGGPSALRVEYDRRDERGARERSLARRRAHRRTRHPGRARRRRDARRLAAPRSRPPCSDCAARVDELRRLGRGPRGRHFGR